MFSYDTNTLYANSVWAPDTPSFVSVVETVYGFESDWDTFMRLRQDEALSEDTYLDAWSQWLNGDVGITINVAYTGDQFMRIVEPLGHWKGQVSSGILTHRNVWGYDYEFKYSDFDVDVMWVSDLDDYHRVIRYNEGKLFLDDRIITNFMCDYGILSSSNDYICSSVFLIDASFSSLDDVYKDIHQYGVSNVSLDPLVRYVIGDG